jgi:dihydroflavonol-4-reductase
MKVFVTGGTGFIGSHLIPYLQKSRNAEVYALLRDRNSLNNSNLSGIHLLEGDLFTVPSLPKDLDSVIHLAGITKASRTADYYTVNQKGTASLLAAILSQQIELKRFIYLSSLAASGSGDGLRPILESDRSSPVSAYGRSKMKAELEILDRKDSIPSVILRAAVIFGPGDRNFVPYFKIIKRGILPSPGSIPGAISVCYVNDLIRAIDLAIDKTLPSGEIFNIANAAPCTWAEMGRAAGNILGVKLRKIQIPLFLVYLLSLCSEFKGRLKKKPEIFNRDKYAEMKQKSWVADTKKAEEELGFAARSPFDSAVRETLEWYLEQGWL